MPEKVHKCSTDLMHILSNMDDESTHVGWSWYLDLDFLREDGVVQQLKLPYISTCQSHFLTQNAFSPHISHIYIFHMIKDESTY